MKRSITIILVIVIGALFLIRPATLQPESASRIRTVRQIYAPPGAMPGQADDSSTGESYELDPVHPLVVNFADIDPDAPHSDSMYERWLKGDIDLDEMEGIISAAEIFELQEKAMQMGVTPGVQNAVSGPGISAPVSAGSGFDSIDYNGSGGAVPPDPDMAVGPDHIVVAVNVAVAIYDKSGTALLGPVPAATLFSGPSCTSGLFDPNVLYDEKEDRWIIAYDKGSFSSLGGYCLLASQSGNPLGLWNEYFFQLNSPTAWMDYPHAGVGDSFIFMGGNMFNMGGFYIEGRLFAFNKANLYAGNPVTTLVRGLTVTYDTPQPIKVHGASTGSWPNWNQNHYFLTQYNFDGRNYTLFEWDGTVLVNRGNIVIGTGGYPVQAIQSGGSNIQANDWRPLDFEYRNGYGWMTAAHSCNPGSGTVNCIIWAQINLNTATIGPAGKGIYGSNGDHRYFPDLAVNHCNAMAVGYTKSNASIFPSIFVTGRVSTDPPNSLQSEVQLKAGEIAYTAFDSAPRRWGDYTAMTIDPDGLTFWYIGEYSKVTGNIYGRWGTYVGSYTFPGCSITVLQNIYLPMIKR